MLKHNLLVRVAVYLVCSESLSLARVVPSLPQLRSVDPFALQHEALSTKPWTSIPLPPIAERVAIIVAKGRGRKPGSGVGESSKSDASKESNSFTKDVAKGRDLFEDVVTKRIPKDLKPAEDVITKMENHGVLVEAKLSAPQIFKDKFSQHYISSGAVYTIARIHVPGNPNYVNLNDPKAGVIISRSAFKEMNSKDILFYSDFTYHAYIRVAKQLGVTPRKLAHIGVEDITNGESQSIINEALKLVGSKTTEFTFTQTQHPDGFYALLAAPNLSFIPRMLAQRAHELGDHSISAIAVWKVKGEYGVAVTLT